MYSQKIYKVDVKRQLNEYRICNNNRLQCKKISKRCKPKKPKKKINFKKIKKMNNARPKKTPNSQIKIPRSRHRAVQLKHICLVLPETVLDRFWKRFILKQEWQRRKQMKGRGQSQQQKSLSQKLTKKNVPIFDTCMVCAKFGWNWNSGSREEIFLNSVNLFLEFHYYLPVEKGMNLHLNKLEFPKTPYA